MDPGWCLPTYPKGCCSNIASNSTRTHETRASDIERCGCAQSKAVGLSLMAT